MDDSWIKNLEQVVLTGDSIRFESRVESINRWFDVRFSRVGDEYNRKVAVLFRDITESKLVEESLYSAFEEIQVQAEDLEAQTEELRKANEALYESEKRFELLSEANALLLSSSEPEAVIQTIAEKVMRHLSCDVFFNYVYNEVQGRLHLNAYSGINAAAAKEIEWLDEGNEKAIWGCVACNNCLIFTQELQNNRDKRNDLIQSTWIQAYATEPLYMGEKIIGILSFGTKNRTSFTENELGLISSVANQISIAIGRKLAERKICRYNRVLEGINKILGSVVQAKTEEEMGNACLSVALEVTGSLFGFINEMNTDGLLHDVAKSELAWEQCFMHERTGHGRPLSEFVIRGLYGSVINSEKSFFTNDPQSHPDSIGLPYGHPPITSFLGVPLILDGNITGLIAVANREGGYSSEQQEDLEKIASAVVQALQRKKEEKERERIEEALRESEERFRLVLENSLDSAYCLDFQNSCFDYISPVIEQITGFPPEKMSEITRSGLLEHIHPNDRPLVIAGITRSLDEGFGIHEYRFKCKDGKYRWLSDYFSIMKDETGTARFRAGIVRDITESKKAEEALRLSNLYNRSLIEAGLDPLVTIGPDGKITDVNSSTESVTGYSRKELIGTDFSDYYTEPEKAREGYQHVFQKGLVRDYPLEIRHKGGHITPVLYNASVYRNENGEVIGVFAAARDITELKKAEEEIRTLANIVESSNDAIITESLNGVITSWNKGAEQIYGYLAEEVLGKNVSILEPDNLKGEIKHLSEKIKQGKHVRHHETLRLRKDGTIVNISVTLSPVFDASGKLVAISNIAGDITEKKIAENLLHEKQIAEIANRTKSEFLANMSHELRTPLNSIIGFSDILYEQIYGELNRKQLRAVGNVSSSGKHLLNLINGILDLSKIEANKMELDCREFKLAAKLNLIRNILLPIADKKNIKIEIDVGSELTRICADEDKFIRIMYNLVDNAIKFSYENSFIKIRARKKGDMVEITVKDNGVGIKTEDQHKLFKPFSQVNSFSSKKFQGTGLGLSLVKQIVNLHEGYVWFRSEPGEGSTFAFAIPIAAKVKVLAYCH